MTSVQRNHADTRPKNAHEEQQQHQHSSPTCPRVFHFIQKELLTSFFSSTNRKTVVHYHQFETFCFSAVRVTFAFFEVCTKVNSLFSFKGCFLLRKFWEFFTLSTCRLILYSYTSRTALFNRTVSKHFQTILR